MTEHFSFFDAIQDSNGHYDREYNAQQFTDYFKSLVTTGVMKGAYNQLEVTANGSNMTSSVKSGVAFVEGRYYYNDALLQLTHDTEVIGLSRIDRIVVRMDLSTDARYVKTFIKKGVPAASPVPPTLTQTQQLYEISLAQVRVVGGQTYIANNAVTDERGKNVICPWAGSKILPNYDDATLQELLESQVTDGQFAKKYSGNLDDLLASGMYSVDSGDSTSLPEANSSQGRPWIVQVITDKDTGASFQIATQSIAGSALYFRNRTIIGVWTSWNTLLTNNIMKSGNGSPEGVVAASQGTIYLRTDGTTTTTLYVKTSGTGNVGWTAK